MEREASLRFSFRVYDLRKFKDGGAHGLTEAERYSSLSERTGVDEYAGYCQRRHISDLVNDYFIARPIGNDESDSDLCESSDDDFECDPELDLFLDEAANGSVNDDSVGVDLTTCVEGLEYLADFIMPRDPAVDDPETVSVFLVTCSCKLNDGQPCHNRYPPEELSDVRLQYGSMTHDELDIAVLAKLSCGMHRTTMTA